MSRRLAFAVAALFCSNQARAVDWAAPGQAPSVGVFLDFEHTPSASLIRAMEREVAAVLATTGIRFSWLSLKQDTGAGAFNELAVLRFQGTCRFPALGVGGNAASASPRTLGATDV